MENVKGFSITELMIGIGILGGLIVGVMHLQKSSLTTQKRSIASLETQNIINNINQTLLNTKSCKNTLEQVPTLQEGTQIATIKNGHGGTVFDTNTKYGGNSVKIDSMTIVKSTTQDNYGEIEIELKFERLSSEIADAVKFVSHPIHLRVQVDNNNKVTGCHSATENARETSKMEACHSIGGEFVAGIEPSLDICKLADYPRDLATNIGVSNNYLKQYGDENYVNLDGDIMVGDLHFAQGTKICVNGNCRDFTEASCPAGQLAVKVKGDGTLECISINCQANEFFAGLLRDNRPDCKSLPTQNCNANQYIKEIKANGEVVCEDLAYRWETVCASGMYIEKIEENGKAKCKSLREHLAGLGKCGNNQFMVGFKDDGKKLDCKRIPGSSSFPPPTL